MSVVKPNNVPPSIIMPAANASGFGQSSFDPYDLGSDDEESLTPKIVTKMTPGRIDCAARCLTAARFYLNSPPALPKN